MSEVKTMSAVHGGARDAGEPFNATDADVILRSVDNVEFRVHRIILVHASRFFATLFTLPAPASDASGHDKNEGLTVIKMSESEDALHRLLSLCYPNAAPTMDNVDELSLSICLTHKFELPGAANAIKYRLLSLTPSSPVRAYALGWILESREVVHLAAKESLSQPLLEITPQPQYEQIPGSAIVELLAFHRRCLQSVPKVVSSMDWLSFVTVPAAIQQSVPNADNTGRCSCNHFTSLALSGGAQFQIKHWCNSYLETVTAELQSCPHPSVVKRFASLKNIVPRSLYDCSTCKSAAFAALDEFSDVLVTQIEKITTEALDDLRLPF